MQYIIRFKNFIEEICYFFKVGIRKALFVLVKIQAHVALYKITFSQAFFLVYKDFGWNFGST